MLVEHSFVTTLDDPRALAAARAFLIHCGYQLFECNDRVLSLTRGRAKPSSKVSFRDLPQQVRVEYDRGRVVIAASIQEFRKVHSLHREMLLALASGLDGHLVRGQPLDEAAGPFHAVLVAVAQEFHRRRRRRGMAVGCLVTFIVAVIVLVVIGIANS